MYTNSRAGKWKVNLSGDMSYRSFCPSNLPPHPSLNIDNRLQEVLLSASKSIAKLDVAASLIPNIDLFISMYVRKEALLSSQIEGTQCTLDDILDPNIESNTNLDVADVVNYVNAYTFAIKRMETLPLCNRLLCEIHNILMSGSRGEEKYPGQFRKSQNWIGASTSHINDARYIPPNVDDMHFALEKLEDYINNDNSYDTLIQTGLIHYQFETIHPFLDGNGRIGRLLIILCLIEKGCLTNPVLYASYFLKKNQLEYYDRMSEVRKTGNYEQWVIFFLESINEAAKDSLNTAQQLSKLHQKNIELLPPSNRKDDNVKLLFSYIEKHPIIDIGATASSLHVSFNTISSAVNKLVKIGILKEKTNALRNRVFAYEDYLTILRQDT